MGKRIDLSRPITDEERAYLLSRAREDEVVANDRQFGGKSDAEKRKATSAADEAAEEEASYEVEEEEDFFDPDLVDQVAPLSVRELQQRLEKLGLKPKGKKDELQIQLLEALEGQGTNGESE